MLAAIVELIMRALANIYACLGALVLSAVRVRGVG